MDNLLCYANYILTLPENTLTFKKLFVLSLYKCGSEKYWFIRLFIHKHVSVNNAGLQHDHHDH